jgi:hypothetical protein
VYTEQPAAQTTGVGLPFQGSLLSKPGSISQYSLAESDKHSLRRNAGGNGKPGGTLIVPAAVGSVTQRMCAACLHGLVHLWMLGYATHRHPLIAVKEYWEG